MKIILCLFVFCFILSCTQQEKKDAELVSQTDTIKKDTLSAETFIEKNTLLQLDYPVDFDSLLKSILYQKKVKVLDSLTESGTTEVYTDEHQENHEWTHTYKGKFYSFKLKEKEDKEGNRNAIFTDGKTEIDFSKHTVTFPAGSRPGTFGFNNQNTLYAARVIEVCGQKFVYADLLHQCTGTGCGVNLIMIYDLQYKKATFITNFRINFDGFFLSDFNNDNKPDLLIFNHNNENSKKDIRPYTEEMELCAYQYNKGSFVPYIDQKHNRPYKYILFGIGDDDLYTSPNSYEWSLYKDDWF